MSTMQEMRLDIRPRVIFDIRDWYRSTITSPLIPVGGTFERAIIRPVAEVRLKALPTSPPDPNWPFGTPVELVTQVAASGIRAFHGRVRVLTGTLVSKYNRRLTASTTCQLEISAPGFQSHQIPNAVIAGPADDPTIVRPVYLYPDVNYTYPVGPRLTVLRGLVEDANSLPVASAAVRIKSTGVGPGQTSLDVEVISNLDGEWFLATSLPSVTSQDRPEIEVTANHAGLTASISVLAHPELFNPVPPIILA